MPSLPQGPKRVESQPVGKEIERVDQEPLQEEPELAPKQEKKATVRRPPAKPIADEPVETPPPPPAKPAEIPQLTPMMAEHETRELNRAIDAALANADQILRPIRARERNATQQNLLDQADAFARQARDIRASDPAAAKSLAERAEQLSRELLSTYR